MNTPLHRLARRPRPPFAALAALCVMTALLRGCASAQHDQQTTQSQAQPFRSPDAAVQALTAAVRNRDKPQLLAIMGPDSQDIISSGDDVADQQRAQRFLTLYDQKHALTDDDAGRKTLVIGNTDWPFPVPLVRQGKSWRFDAAAGREEILNRRIGDNELSAIQVCKAIADAQHEYALRDPDGSGIQQYARKIISDPGKRNGLYWPTGEGEAPSPLGELVAAAQAEGYQRQQSGGPSPYHGYYYRILQAQGPHAPNGAIDYVVDGKMTLGFALVAWPADYGNSGIMTFLTAPDGTVYQKDLGTETPRIAAEMKTLDPAEGWTKLE